VTEALCDDMTRKPGRNAAKPRGRGVPCAACEVNERSERAGFRERLPQELQDSLSERRARPVSLRIPEGVTRSEVSLLAERRPLLWLWPMSSGDQRPGRRQALHGGVPDEREIKRRLSGCVFAIAKYHL